MSIMYFFVNFYILKKYGINKVYGQNIDCTDDGNASLDIT